MNDEMESIMKNQTWDLVELLEEKKPCITGFIGWRRRMTGQEVQGKIGWEGISTMGDIDFIKSFSPAEKLTTLDLF